MISTVNRLAYRSSRIKRDQSNHTHKLRRQIAAEIDALISALEGDIKFCCLDSEIAALRRCGYRLIEKLHRAEAA